MEGENKGGVNFFTMPNQGNAATDTMAMMMNNPFMYLVMMAWLNNGGCGNNRNVEAQLAAMQGQINDNNNNAIAREAIQGNGFAISQLAQNLNVDANSLRAAVGDVKDAIFALGSKNDMGFMGVTNTVNLGNLNMIQQLKDCCCAMQKQTMEQGYQGRIETIQQTDDIKTAIRVENGLTRTEVAAFRQAWENARYQDVVAEKTRLQTELDLLRQQDANTAALANFINPLKSQIQLLEWQMQQYIVKPTGVAASAASNG
jgi:hypothetical protein